MTTNGEKPAKTIAKSKRKAKVLQPVGTYGQGSVEKAKQLPMLPKMAERVARKCYRIMCKINGKDVEVVVRTWGKCGVRFKRACARCGKASREKMATPGDVFCAKIECGGKKDESNNRATNAKRKAKRDANEPALQALMDDYEVPRAPDNVNDAKDGQTYAMLNRANGQKPSLVRRVRAGKVFKYEAWCACKNGGKTLARQCNICVGKRPEGKKKDLKAFCTECKQVRVLPPDYICAGCRGAPAERKQAKIQKADAVAEAIAMELKRVGRDDLIPKITSDCTKRDALTDICSGRREDLDLNATPRYNINMEVSEDQHKGTRYSAQCEKRKYSGQLMDRGAPGFTEADGKLMDCEPTDEYLEEVAETELDTPQYRMLRIARREAVDRVLRAIRKRDRRIRNGDDSYVPMKMRVLHFNPDSFVDRNGVKQPGLFRELPPDKRDGSVRFMPLHTLYTAVRPYVAEVVRLVDQAQDDAWVDARPSLAVAYWRYDGCNASGRPVQRSRTLFKA